MKLKVDSKYGHYDNTFDKQIWFHFYQNSGTLLCVIRIMLDQSIFCSMQVTIFHLQERKEGMHKQ